LLFFSSPQLPLLIKTIADQRQILACAKQINPKHFLDSFTCKLLITVQVAVKGVGGAGDAATNETKARKRRLKFSGS